MPIANRSLPGSEEVIGCLGGGIYLYRLLDGEMTVEGCIKETFVDFLESIGHLIFDHEDMNLNGPAFRFGCDVFANFIDNKIIGDKNLSVDYDKTIQVNETAGYYSLAFIVSEYRDGLSFELKYNTGLYSDEAIRLISETYLRVLQAMIE